MKLTTTTAPRSSVHRFPARLLGYAAWGYALVVIAACAVMYLLGDRWWPATMLLFSPRWLIAIPLVMLVPLALWLNRRLLLPLLLSALVILGPFMGLQFSFGRAKTPHENIVRVITCNINNGTFDVKALRALILETGADVLALQECPRDIAPMLDLPGWQHVQESDLAVLSRFPVQKGGLMSSIDPLHGWPRGVAMQVLVKTPFSDLVLCSVHLTSPRYGLQHVLDRQRLVNPAKSAMLTDETVRRWQTALQVQKMVASLNLPVIIAGDLNMPTASAIYRAAWSNYANAFSRVGNGYGWTVRGDVRGIPVRVRIDHVLTGKGLVPRVCEVGPDVGSDHLPVIADVGFGR